MIFKIDSVIFLFYIFDFQFFTVFLMLCALSALHTTGERLAAGGGMCGGHKDIKLIYPGTMCRDVTPPLVGKRQCMLRNCQK
jgi:hypothetical protein